MKTLIENFSKQLREAIEIGKKSEIHNPQSEIRNVIVTGLGGSGIGGTIVSEIVSGECPVPIVVNKDYFLPAFVNENSLVIVSSYSGNTEETIQAMEAALKAKAKIVCVTSGGKISEMAKKNNCDIITIPGGSPPRAALAYSLTQLFFILKKFQLVKSDFEKQLNDSIALLAAEENNIRNEAMEIAEFLFNKIPVIYAADGYNGVATRFRQQLNENSKMLCWHHILPEMNHNELVGWAGGRDDLAIVILRNKTDYQRTQSRIEFSKKVFAQHTPHIKEIWSKGKTKLEQSIYLIHLTDWVSLFLAEKKGVDAVEVNIINQLKDTLGKS
ncbi:MAG TPA: bifunctional phosphoglucose/phosphomannose isomerase [Bacteroidia bacterium]|nr:bifunctional phosphoglucose/phosphomannose isomerase [Bacteroidia bacterium]